MRSFAHDRPGVPAARWRDEVARRDLPLLSLADVERVVVVGAHPDDETLGAGGLVAQAHRLGLEVVVVVATRGERSHPRSTTCSAAQLAELRGGELRAAVELLAPGTVPTLLDLPDGALAEHERALATALVDTVGDGRGTLLVATWRGDGHPDHEAAGRAAATAAARTGARLLEYPVWSWHWAEPVDLPWPTARRLDLTAADRSAKREAVAAHRTQVEPLSPAAGDEVLLTADVLEHFAAEHEVFWQLAPGDDALEELHAGQDDPWGVDRRWYERRKRDLVLAALPRERFARAVEVGCSTGALSDDLAARCDRLVALDFSPSAIAAAVRRLAHHPHVEVALAAVPDDWDRAGTDLDLVVLSEVAYFLSPAALEALADRVASSLAQDGVVVLCHWRHEIEGWPLDGPAAHDLLRSSGLPPVSAEYRDRDVEILVLCDPAALPVSGD